MSCRGRGLESMWPTSSFSSCFCTSSGTPHTASALVRPSSVVLIHMPSELKEREGLLVYTAFSGGVVLSCSVSVQLWYTSQKMMLKMMSNYGTVSLQIGTALQRIRRLLQRGGRLPFNTNTGFVHTYVHLEYVFGALFRSLIRSFIAQVSGASVRTCGAWFAPEMRKSNRSGLRNVVSFYQNVVA